MHSALTPARGVAALAVTLLVLGSAPLVGTASAATPALRSVSPQDGSHLRTGPTVVSATYDQPLASTSTLRLSRNGTDVATCLSSVSSSTVRCSSLTALPEGAYTATATARSTSASDAPATTTFRFTVDSTPPVPPTVKISPDPVTPSSHQAVTVSGGTEPGADVHVVLDDRDAGTAPVVAARTADADGSYTATLDARPLADGPLAGTVTVSDRAGNTSSGSATATKDTAAPRRTSFTPSGPAKPGTSTAPTKAAATFDEPLADSSRIRVLNAVGNAVAGSGSFVDDGRTIVFTPSPALTDGAYEAVVSAVDAAGNAGESRFGFEIDGQAPQSPTVLWQRAADGKPEPVNAAGAQTAAVSGTGFEAGIRIVLSADDSDPLTRSVTTQEPVVTSDSGGYAATLDVRGLRDGEIVVTASARDQAGNESAGSGTDRTSKDVVAPATPSVRFDVSQVTAENRRGVTVTGSLPGSATGPAEAGVSLAVVVDDTDPETPPVQPDVAVTSDADGSYTSGALDLAMLSDGPLTATVTPTDSAGNAGVAGTATVGKDTTAPDAPALSAPDFVNAANAGAYEVSGRAEPGSTAQVVLSDATRAVSSVVTVSQGGSYSTRLDATSLRDGPVTLTASAADGAGNRSATTSAQRHKDTVAPVAPSLVTSDPINQAGQGEVAVSGAVEALSTVTVTVVDDDRLNAAVVTQSHAADEKGRYAGSVDVSALSDGVLTFTAVATDAAGNSGPIGSTRSTKDTVAPGRPSISSTAPSPLRAGDSLTVSGTAALADRAASGQTARVTVTDGQATLERVDVPVATTSGDFQTSFSATELAELSDGTLAVSAAVVDTPGNVGAPASATVVKNATSLSFVSSSPGQDATVQPPGSIALTFNEPLQADNQDGTPRSTIELRDRLGGVLACARGFSDDGRTIRCTPAATLRDAGSPYRVTVLAYDAVGESMTEAVTFSVDGTAPLAPAIGEVTSPVNAENVADVSAAVTDVEDGAGVRLRIQGADGSSVESRPELQADGSHLADGLDLSALPDGELQVTATATDAVGNTSESSPARTVPKDTRAPVNSGGAPAEGSTVRPPASVRLLFDEPLAPSSALTLRNGQTEVAGGSALGEDGRSVVFTPSTPLVDGSYLATAAVTDAAGNPASGSSSFRVDGTGPAVSGLKASPTFVGTPRSRVTGQSDPGAQVRISATSAGSTEEVVETTAADAAGALDVWLDLSGLADGTVTVTAAAVDDLGNEGEAAVVRTTKDTRRTDQVAVRGTNLQLYVRSTDSAYTSLGGSLKDAPAVVSTDAGTWFVALGQDDHVYVRTATLGWKRMSPAGTQCIAPSAAASGSTLAVACKGTNGRLYSGKATLTAGQLPTLGRWTDLGGSLKFGPAVSADSGTFRYFAVGMNGRLYQRTDASGFGLAGPACSGAPAADASGQLTACADASGRLQVVRGGLVVAVLSGPAAVLGRPAVAVDSDGTARFYTVLADGSRNVYQATRHADGTRTGFTRLGGYGAGGVAARSTTARPAG